MQAIRTKVNNQKGFTVLEGLIIVLIIAVVGSAGYYIWSQNNDDATKRTEASQKSPVTEQKQQKDNNEQTPTAAMTVALYSNKEKGIEFEYPNTWKEVNRADNPEVIFFASPDFVAPKDDSIGATAEAGFLLQISVSKQTEYESYEEDLENAPNAQLNHGGFFETIKIDGHNAILSNTKTHGTYIHTTAYKEGMTYSFALHAPDDDNPEVKRLFLKILESVKFI